MSGANEIGRALAILLEPGQVTELRVLGWGHRGDTVSGYFDDPVALVTSAAQYDKAKGLYIIPNPVKPALLARAANRARVVGRDPTTGDSDIVCRRWLLIDCDPTRPAGISSTDNEHQSAIQRAHEIRATLAKAGWPDGLLADSGNGAHLLYRIHLPVDDGGLTKRVLSALDFRFGDAAVTIDQTVSTPPGSGSCTVRWPGRVTTRRAGHTGWRESLRRRTSSTSSHGTCSNS